MRVRKENIRFVNSESDKLFDHHTKRAELSLVVIQDTFIKSYVNVKIIDKIFVVNTMISKSTLSEHVKLLLSGKRSLLNLYEGKAYICVSTSESDTLNLTKPSFWKE